MPLPLAFALTGPIATLRAVGCEWSFGVNNMMHPHTELRPIDRVIGYGVFATQAIPRGTLTWVLDPFDRILTPRQVAELTQSQRDQVEEYAYVDPHGNYVLCWDLGRYVNHSCEPTSRGVGTHAEIAVRDIAPGEQLTSDYAELNITATFACRCGAASCRGRVGVDQLLRDWRQWDESAANAVTHMAGVPQPLWHFVKDEPVLQRLVRDPQALPSRLHYYAGGSSSSSIDESAASPANNRLWRLDTPGSSPASPSVITPDHSQPDAPGNPDDPSAY